MSCFGEDEEEPIAETEEGELLLSLLSDFRPKSKEMWRLLDTPKRDFGEE